jgi:hypothetical protein
MPNQPTCYNIIALGYSLGCSLCGIEAQIKPTTWRPWLVNCSLCYFILLFLGTCWELFENPLRTEGNIMRTFWEFSENSLKTLEFKKIKIILKSTFESPPNPTQTENWSLVKKNWVGPRINEVSIWKKKPKPRPNSSSWET